MTVDFAQIAAIRLGYGLSPHMPPPRDADAVLASIPEAAPDAAAVTTDTARTRQMAFQAAAKDMAGDPERLKQHRRSFQDIPVQTLLNRMARAIDAPVGFGERLVGFWADHFTVRLNAPALEPVEVALVDDAIRPHLAGRFADLLFAATTHPAMVTYLDQNRSFGPNGTQAVKAAAQGKALGLNENLARELLELHTLGIDSGYTQDDVHQMARVLTGLAYVPATGQKFAGGRAEPGPITVLGRTYRTGKPSLDDIRKVLTDVAGDPRTARHLCRKLAVHFVSDTPDAALIEDLTLAWTASGGDLMQVYGALVRHPALLSGFRQKVRQPFDWIAASLRGLGLRGDTVRGWDRPVYQPALLVPLQTMGQPWGLPQGPDGWPEAAGAWISPPQLAARIDWAMNLPAKLMDPLPDPRDLLRTALGGTASSPLAWAVPKAESLREGVGLVLASADFNRR